jgi:hypothetical protein
MIIPVRKNIVCRQQGVSGELLLGSKFVLGHSWPNLVRQAEAPSQYRQRIGEPRRIPLMLFDKTAKQQPIKHKSSVEGSVVFRQPTGKAENLLQFFAVR